MHPARRILVTTVLVGATGLTGCAAGTGSDAAPTPDRATVTSGPETGDQLVHGRVLDDGEPLSGARVWVEVQPDQDEMAALRAGEVVDTFTVAAVTTDARGRYAVFLDPDELPPGYLQYGVVNHEIWVWDDGRTITWNTPAHLLPGDLWRTHESDLPADPTTSLSVDLARSRVVLVESSGDRVTGEVEVFDAPADAVPDRTG